MPKTKKLALVLVLALLPLPSFLHGEDTRQTPLELYVVIDGSAALKNVRQEALDWFSEQLVGRILQDGDRLSVWIAADKAELVFSDTLKGAEGREALRERLRSAEASGKTADFAGALREAAGRGSAGAGSGGLPPYTILITGASGGLFPAPEGKDGRLLRYSRVEEFSGWRVLYAAPGIEEQVRKAAAAYLRQGS